MTAKPTLEEFLAALDLAGCGAPCWDKGGNHVASNVEFVQYYLTRARVRELYMVGSVDALLSVCRAYEINFIEKFDGHFTGYVMADELKERIVV